MRRWIAQTLRVAQILLHAERLQSRLRWGGAVRLLPTPGRARQRPWLGVIASVLVLSLGLVVLVKLVGRVYYDPALSAIAGWSVPPDFSDFYLAAEAVGHGSDPYAIDLPAGWLGYVYPPLFAFLMTPLTFLSVPTAVTMWALLSLWFVVAALWILGVRDWRCYLIALLWPFNREAVEFGTIDGLLLLAIALCWRYRDSPVRASASAGFAVALKLFLWPVAAWFGLTGRTRTALGVVTAAALLVLLPWAFIGFQGLGAYPGLIRQVAEQQDHSYSVASLAETLNVASSFARVLSVAVGAWLLYLAFRAARENGQSARARDARSLTLTLAASLALTPVVWNHYLILLLVPVAIARPRLSAMWFMPLALSALYLVDGYGPSPDTPLPLLTVSAVAALTVMLALGAQRQPTARAATRTWTAVRRTAAPAIAIVAVLLVVFVAVPEKLNDRPYNPLGRDTSILSEQSKPRQ